MQVILYVFHLIPIQILKYRQGINVGVEGESTTPWLLMKPLCNTSSDMGQRRFLRQAEVLGHYLNFREVLLQMLHFLYVLYTLTSLLAQKKGGQSA